MHGKTHFKCHNFIGSPRYITYNSNKHGKQIEILNHKYIVYYFTAL